MKDGKHLCKEQKEALITIFGITVIAAVLGIILVGCSSNYNPCTREWHRSKHSYYEYYSGNLHGDQGDVLMCKNGQQIRGVKW